MRTKTMEYAGDGTCGIVILVIVFYLDFLYSN